MPLSGNKLIKHSKDNLEYMGLALCTMNADRLPQQ